MTVAVTPGRAVRGGLAPLGTDDGIRGFVVPTDTAGFAAPEVKRKLSLRASVTSELVLDDVRLPGSAMLPGARGLSGPLSCLTEARFGIIFGSLGAARDCLETTIAYSREREIFDLAARGFSNSEIAQHEYVSEATVKTHISRVLTKLELRDRVRLVVFAHEHGLVTKAD